MNVTQNQVNTVASPQGYQAPPYGQMFPQPTGVVPPPPQPQQPALGGVTGLNPAGAPPNLTNLITSLDGPTLQKLLGALQQQHQPGGAGPTATPHHPSQQPPQHHQQAQSAAPHPALPADLASLLGGNVAGATTARPPHQPLAYSQPQPQAQANPFAAIASNPALAGNPILASFLANTAAGGGMNRPVIGGVGQAVAGIQHQAGAPTTGQQPTAHVQNIMEQLAKWKQA